MFNRFSCLHDFVGYGPKQPRFVFLGIEEYGEGSELSFETRCSLFKRPLFDKNEACRLLASIFRDHGQDGIADRYERAMRPGYARVWKFCSMIAAAVRTPSDWVTNWRSEYEALGSRSGDTLLTWLFPIPKPGIKYWPQKYHEWFGWDNYNKYYTAIWPFRQKLLQAVVLNELTPGSIVLCFGRTFWDKFEDLLGLQRQDWNVVIPGRAEGAVTPQGLQVVRTGFPFGRPSGGPVTTKHVPLIAKELSLPPNTEPQAEA